MAWHKNSSRNMIDQHQYNYTQVGTLPDGRRKWRRTSVISKSTGQLNFGDVKKTVYDKYHNKKNVYCKYSPRHLQSVTIDNGNTKTVLYYNRPKNYYGKR